MTLEQLKDEKLSVQKALLQYENSHGRPVRSRNIISLFTARVEHTELLIRWQSVTF